MKHARLAELVRDRDRRWGIDDHQTHRRIARFGGEQLNAPGVFIAFPRYGKGAGRSPATAAGSPTPRPAAGRSGALASATTRRGNPVDVESDLGRPFAKRAVERPDTAERRNALREHRHRKREMRGSRRHETDGPEGSAR